MQWIRSFVYVIQIYAMMVVFGVLFSPWAILSPKGARAGCKTWCRWAIWTARWMIGLTGEVRGTVPEGEVLVASKHQSFFDVILIFNALPAGKFIMKRELLWTPFIGLYGKRLGCVAVTRGKRGAAISKMVRDVQAGRALPGQLIIYPQGTRVPPGVHKPYKQGTAVLYRELGQTCVPAATNVGLFWPRKGILRKPGHAVVEFLPVIDPGMETADFMTHLEEVIETRTEELAQEARNGVRH